MRRRRRADEPETPPTTWSRRTSAVGRPERQWAARDRRAIDVYRGGPARASRATGALELLDTGAMSASPLDAARSRREARGKWANRSSSTRSCASSAGPDASSTTSRRWRPSRTIGVDGAGATTAPGRLAPAAAGRPPRRPSGPQPALRSSSPLSSCFARLIVLVPRSRIMLAVAECDDRNAPRPCARVRRRRRRSAARSPTSSAVSSAQSRCRPPAYPSTSSYVRLEAMSRSVIVSAVRTPFGGSAAHSHAARRPSSERSRSAGARPRRGRDDESSTR